MAMILGHSLNPAAGTIGESFSPLDLSPAAWWVSDMGVLDATSVTPDNAENVMTWQDQSGNGNHLTQATAGFRPSYRTADGPNGGPCIRFELEQLKVTALNATITDPTVYFICKKTHTTSAYMYSGDGTPTFYLQNTSAGLSQAGISAGTSGNFTFSEATWGLQRLEALQGAGETQWNDAQAKATTVFGVSTLDGFSLGSRIDYVLQANFDVAELIIVSGALSDTNLRKMRLYAASKYGFSWSSEYGLSDTFTRADTADSNLGTSDTGHLWELSGSGMANARILGNGYTVSSPWSTVYAWPQINFKPSTIAWSYDEIDYGGGGGDSVNAVGITKARQSLLDMVHFVWAPTGWRLERWYPAGGSAVVVAQSAYVVSSGNMRLAFNWTAGTITVHDANGVSTLCDWNGTVGAGTLSDYQTSSIFYEVIAPLTPGKVVRYTKVSAS